MFLRVQGLQRGVCGRSWEGLGLEKYLKIIDVDPPIHEKPPKNQSRRVLGRSWDDLGQLGGVLGALGRVFGRPGEVLDGL